MSNYKNEIKHSAKSTYNHAKDETLSTLDSIKDSAESAVHHAKESVTDAYYEGKKQVEKAFDVASEQGNHLMNLIKDKPISSILIAGGIGFLISQIIKFNSNTKD